MSLPRESLFSGKVKFGGLKAMWVRADPRYVAAVALVCVTGVMLRLGLASSPRCTITELSLGYKINYARIQLDAEQVMASAPNWVDDPMWFRDPVPESPMNEPGKPREICDYQLFQGKWQEPLPAIGPILHDIGALAIDHAALLGDACGFLPPTSLSLVFKSVWEPTYLQEPL